MCIRSSEHDTNSLPSPIRCNITSRFCAFFRVFTLFNVAVMLALIGICTVSICSQHSAHFQLNASIGYELMFIRRLNGLNLFLSFVCSYHTVFCICCADRKMCAPYIFRVCVCSFFSCPFLYRSNSQ